jgi:stearoyl-CoA desaturase (delta-9 desaturase)
VQHRPGRSGDVANPHGTSGAAANGRPRLTTIDWLLGIPFIALHLACLGVIWVGWSPIAVTVAAVVYLVRMFAVTGFYHRYFSHRSFKTSRPVQCLFAVIGNAAVQKGPLWWAAHHRLHHRYSDRPEDVHSPIQHGFLWSHVGWFFSRSTIATRFDVVPDLARFRELVWLDRYHFMVPLLLAAGLWGLGHTLESTAPELGTSGAQMLVWGFFISTIALAHATYTINSLSHRLGSRRYATSDTSRNNVWLALLTMGEGWHNNHHHFPASVRQGFFWWEVDVTFYLLRFMQWLGLIWDLRPVPAKVRSANLVAGTPTRLQSGEPA